MKRPTALRKLKAVMVLKSLTLRTVCELAEVNYSVASEVLSGRLKNPRVLKKIRQVVADSPPHMERIELFL